MSLDLLAGYAEVGLICVHGYMLDTVDRPGELEPVGRRSADHQDAPAPDLHRGNAPTLQ
jgi:hypothetical protein